MTKKIENAYVAAIDARIAHEKARATACAASMKFLTDARAFCERENVHAFLASANVDAAFFNANVNASDKFCMKAINRAMQYVQYAMSKSAILKVENARVVLETAINLHRANMQMTRADAQASCTSKADKSVSVDKDKAKYIVRRDTIVAASKRQSSMSLLALQALDIIKQVSKDAFELNTESKLTQALLANHYKQV